MTALRPHLRWPIATPSPSVRLAGAVLLALSAAINWGLYLTGYSSIPTIGWLFPLHVIAGFALAAAMLVTSSRLVAAAGAGFELATLGGYLLSVPIGLIGFNEIHPVVGIAAGLIEVAAFTALALTAVAAGPVRQIDEPVSPAARLLDRMQAAAPVVITAVAGVLVVTLIVLLGVVVTK
jgi:hypothetical protein